MNNEFWLNIAYDGNNAYSPPLYIITVLNYADLKEAEVSIFIHALFFLVQSLFYIDYICTLKWNSNILPFFWLGLRVRVPILDKQIPDPTSRNLW